MSPPQPPPQPPAHRPLSAQEKELLSSQLEEELSRHPKVEQFGVRPLLWALLPIVLRVVEEFLKERLHQSGSSTSPPV
jgi:hypothetical protein